MIYAAVALLAYIITALMAIYGLTQAATDESDGHEGH